MLKRAAALCAALILCLALFSGCGVSDTEKYDNFLLDLDIEGRLNDLAYLLGRGTHSPGIRTELNTIYYDLKTLKMDNPRIQAVNNQYIICVEIFLQAANENYKGRPEKAQEYLDTALEVFQNANRDLSAYKREINQEKQDGF